MSGAAEATTRTRLALMGTAISPRGARPKLAFRSIQEKGRTMAAPNTISVDKLVRLIGTPKCPLLVDVRPQEDFEADPHLIPSSIHCASNKLEDRAEAYDRQSAIVICQKISSLRPMDPHG
jgi:Rhodanese-like domain